MEPTRAAPQSTRGFLFSSHNIFFLFIVSNQAEAPLRGRDMADYGACGKKVAKSAKALACDFCRLWYHMSCTGLTDSDYDFMKSRKGLGFRWFCGNCISSADSAVGTDRTVNQVDEKLSNIVAAVEGINQRLRDLEVRTGSTGDLGPVSSLTLSGGQSVRLGFSRRQTRG